MNHIFEIFDTQLYDCFSCPKCGIGSWMYIEDLLKNSAWNKRFNSKDVLNNFYNSLKDPNITNLPLILPSTFYENETNFPPVAHNNIIYLIQNHLPDPGTIVSILDCDLSDEEWIVKDIIK